MSDLRYVDIYSNEDHVPMSRPPAGSWYDAVCTSRYTECLDICVLDFSKSAPASVEPPHRLIETIPPTQTVVSFSVFTNGSNFKMLSYFCPNHCRRALHKGTAARAWQEPIHSLALAK